MRYVVTLAILSLLAPGALCPAATPAHVEATSESATSESRTGVVLFFDDMESGTNGWTTLDETAIAVSRFHIDTYMPFEGDYSWWCGNFDYDTDGGYGNNWDERLVIPTVDLSGCTYPILTYAFRHDSEVNYDFTYVQAESGGVYVNLNRGYDGMQSWTDIGIYGFILVQYDDPLKARFRFVSDGSYSDEDGLYLSVGGGFMCDIVKVFDYFGGYTYFYDDVETGGLCTPSVPVIGGDWWHIIDRKCPAYSDPHSWWCGDDADTSLIPPNLRNSLISPLIDVSGAVACTLRYKGHFEMPPVDNDRLCMLASSDTGRTWLSIHCLWGDFGTCYGWGSVGDGVDLSWLLPADNIQVKWTLHTTENGCGPGGAGGAGFMLDDVLVVGDIPYYACCRDDTCSLTTQTACETMGGVWHIGATTCTPNPCIPNQTYLVRPDGTGDYPTIQAAVSAATHGDTVSLANGVFSGYCNRDIEVFGKALYIRSQSGDASSCVINAAGGAGFVFQGGETRDAVVSCVGISSAENSGLRFSAGSSPTITGCAICDCAGPDGGAVACDSSAPLFESCTFVGNSSAAGCLAASSTPAPELVGCTFCDNTDESGSGACLTWSDGAAPAIENSIIAYTEGGAGSDGGSPTFACTDIYGNGLGDWTGGIASQLGIDGNFSAAPSFCGREGRDFTLQSTSPCSPDSNAACGLVGAWPVGCSPHERACCVEGECSILTSAECSALGGDWLAGVSACDSLTCDERACCHNDTCTTQREWECVSSGGSWRWDTASCDPDPCAERACCHAAGCDVLTELDCLVLGGEWIEGVSSCDPYPCEIRVCCLDDTCEMLLEWQCQQAGGTWFPGLVSCTGNPCVLSVAPDGSGEYPTIQAAVGAAVDGQIIELEDGTYTGAGNRNVTFGGKAITVRSQSGNAEDCVVDCESVCRGFLFVDDEESDSVLQDITITHGLALDDGYYGGGGVHAYDSSPTLIGCRFVENSGANGRGGGVACRSSYTPGPRIDRCEFLGNVSREGGGLATDWSNAEVTDCVFAANSATLWAGGLEIVGLPSAVRNCVFIDNSADGFGGAVLLHHNDATLSNCSFHGNHGGEGSGVRVTGDGTYVPTLERCIIANGSGGGTASAVFCDWSNAVLLQCCNLYGNEGGNWVGCVAEQYGQDGNISADPLFCDVDTNDLCLYEGSPCAPEVNPSCGLIGALPVECITGAFEAEPVLGLVPLSAQFTDLSGGSPQWWEWDFESDGVVDDTLSNPSHTYSAAGVYTVKLVAGYEGIRALASREDYIRVIDGNALAVIQTEIVSSDPTAVPIHFVGRDSLGAISLYFDYDDTKLTYAGLETYVPGEMFSGGVVGDKISVQWFDETGGVDPIVPGVDPDTLFAILFTNEVAADSTSVTFDDALCVLGDRTGNTLENVSWVDEHPYGTVYISIGATVTGDVAYYWNAVPVPGAVLSMGPPNPDAVTDTIGHYEMDRYPYGSYTLSIGKTNDLGGINSLDAIKVIRHSTGVEPFGNGYKEQAANVNGDAHINALDAIKIVRAAVGLEALPSGDWAFDPESYTFDPLTTDEIADFTAVRMGDVNGDWAPDGRGRGGGSRDSISVFFPIEEVAIAGEPAQYPMLVTGFDAIGALSLRVTFEDSLLEYAGVTSEVPGVMFTSNLVGNEIRIEWYDPTGGASPITVGSDTLLTISVGLIGSEGDSCDFVFQGSCALGDAAGDPIAGVVYSDGVAVLSGGGTSVDDGAFLVFGAAHNYPNPFNPTTEIQFTLEREERVSLRVYNLTGRLVRELVSEQSLARGVHRRTWDGRDARGRPVASGVYFWQLESREGTIRRRMVLLK